MCRCSDGVVDDDLLSGAIIAACVGIGGAVVLSGVISIVGLSFSPFLFHGSDMN